MAQNKTEYSVLRTNSRGTTNTRMKKASTPACSALKQSLPPPITAPVNNPSNNPHQGLPALESFTSITFALHTLQNSHNLQAAGRAACTSHLGPAQ
ncbi:hypothetical protein I7I48_04392 [Histoplasma ohiense]|nr:hypothetical protein I7I48_04392 [Histoplasma ohiense (nom. inval.)]